MCVTGSSENDSTKFKMRRRLCSAARFAPGMAISVRVLPVVSLAALRALTLRALTDVLSFTQRVSSEEFRRLLQVTAQQRTTRGSVHVHALPSATLSTSPSVEVVARKRLIGKSAVVRNRVKRSLRGAARAAMAGGARRDRRYLIVARESALTAGFEDIVADIGRALRRLGCWDPPAAAKKAARRPQRPSASAAHRRRAVRRIKPKP